MTGAVQGIKKTVNERFLTKWLDGQIYVCVKTFTYLKLPQITQIQHACVLNNKKMEYFQPYPFKTFSHLSLLY
jgi:hypothetical protein